MANFIDDGISHSSRSAQAIGQPVGTTNHQMHGMHIGIVADDIDEMGMNRVYVYVPGISAHNPDITYPRVTPTREPAGADGKPGKIKPELRRGFIMAHPMTPFAGSDKQRETTQSDGRQPQTGQSNGYGFTSQPRNGDMVLVAFAGGDPAKCYHLGCIPKTGEQDMVPGHKPGATSASGAGVSTNVGPRMQKGPTDKEFRPSTVLFNNETDSGRIQDPLRGPGSSSMSRETPSRVTGLKTPGDPDSNMMGHQFVLDDHPDSQLIRLRTSKGAQILLCDTGDFIYMSTRSGKSWIEIDDAGNCFIYSHSSVSIHSEEDFNFHCDRDFNINVGGNYNCVVNGDTRIRMNKGGNITVGEGGGDLDITTINNFHVKTQAEFRMGAKTGITMKSADFMAMQSAKDMTMKTAKALNTNSESTSIKSSKGMLTQTGDDFGVKSGKKVNMKSSGGDFNMDTSANMNATKGSLSVDDAKDVTDAQDPNQADIPVSHSVPMPPQTSGPPTASKGMMKSASAVVPQHEPWLGKRAQHPGKNANVDRKSISKLG